MTSKSAIGWGPFAPADYLQNYPPKLQLYRLYRPVPLSIWGWGWDWIVLLSKRLFCYFCSRFRLAPLRVGWTRPKDCGLGELLMEEILHQVRLVVYLIIYKELIHPFGVHHRISEPSTERRKLPKGYIGYMRSTAHWSSEDKTFFFVRIIYSLKRIKMEPENNPFEKENHLRNLHFWVPAFVFWGCIPLPSCKSVFFSLKWQVCSILNGSVQASNWLGVLSIP